MIRRILLGIFLGLIPAWASSAPVKDDSWRCQVLLGSHALSSLDEHQRTWVSSNFLSGPVWHLDFMRMLDAQSESGASELIYRPDVRSSLRLEFATRDGVDHDYSVTKIDYQTQDEAVDPLFGALSATLTVRFDDGPRDFGEILKTMQAIEFGTEALISEFTRPDYLPIFARYLEELDHEESRNVRVHLERRWWAEPRSLMGVVKRVMKHSAVGWRRPRYSTIKTRANGSELEIFNEDVSLRLEFDPDRSLLKKWIIKHVYQGVTQTVTYSSPGISAIQIRKTFRKLDN